MNVRIIKSPTKGTINIILKRAAAHPELSSESFDTIGLVQGRFIEMVCAADIAEKAANVQVLDVRGSCPQNMILLALLGDTASVEVAIDAVCNSLAEEEKGGL